MMKNLLFVLLALSLPAMGQQKPNADRMYHVVEVLSADSLLGRSSNSPESRVAAKYIVGQFESIGLKPLSGNTFVQDFSWTEMHEGRFFGSNIIGVVPGADPALRDEYIVIGAHYDHIGAILHEGEKVDPEIFNGADDNASGVAGMLEVARLVMASPEKIGRSVIFVAFDAEEKGMCGSTQFLKHCPIDKSKIKAMVSMDMIGRADLCKGVEIDGIGTAKGLSCNNVFVDDAASGFEVLCHKHISSHIFSTDTAPFYSEKIPSVMCSTGIKGPYHNTKDRVENISAPGMAFVADNMYRLLINMSTCESIEFANGIKKFSLGLTGGLELGSFRYSKGPLTNKSRLNYNAGISALAYITPHCSLQADVLYKTVSSRCADGNIFMPSLHVPFFYRLTTRYYLVRFYAGVGGYYNRAFEVKVGGESRSDLSEAKNDYGTAFRLGLSSNANDFAITAEFGINKIFDNAPSARYRSIGVSFTHYF